MTQCHKSVLDWQIANRRADAYILDLAYNAMKTKAPSMVPKNYSGAGDGISRLGSKGTFELKRRLNQIDVTFEWTSASDPGSIQVELSDYVTQYFSWYHMEDTDIFQLSLFTEYQHPGEVFRAHPNYREAISPWYDWAMFRWSKEQRPAKCNRSNHDVDLLYMDAGVANDE
jgi:hypothetical protein